MKKPDHIKDLHPDKRNARKHNPRNIGMIEKSLQELGAGRSILIDQDNNIIAGNGTIEAAGNAGITKLQIVDADGDTIIAVRRKLTKRQATRMALMDNRTAETADWNTDILQELREEEPEVFEDMFSMGELDDILTDASEMMDPEFGEKRGVTIFRIYVETKDAQAFRKLFEDAVHSRFPSIVLQAQV